MPQKLTPSPQSNQVKLVVSKFGGTSMGDASCMRRSAEVSIERNASVVIVSATSGTTNALIDIGRTAESGRWTESEQKIQSLIEKHQKIARELELSEQSEKTKQLQIIFQEIETLAKGICYLRDASPKAMDALMSCGERMSSILFAESLAQVLHKKKNSVPVSNKQGAVKTEVRLIDARDVIVTDSLFGRARPQIAQIAEKCRLAMPPEELQKTIYVSQGFIGRSSEGATTTLGRGGSDLSAALFAEGIRAQELEIWTDVAGIATTDPRICPAAKIIPEISFTEASELATFGAKVLHPATLQPAMRNEIPTFVGSSFEPQLAGTWVKRDVNHLPSIRAIALRKSQTLVTLTTPDMWQTHGFLFQIFKVFNDHKVSIDAVTTSEISVSVTIDDMKVLTKDLLADLKKFAEVQFEEKLSLVSLIGNNINHTPGIARRIFESIADINVRMICLGASRHNFCFLVSEEQGPEVVRRMHKVFIE